MEPSKSKLVRNDIYKTKIIRAVFRTPLDLVYTEMGSIVKVSDYKNNQYEKYLTAFRKVFDAIWNELIDYELVPIGSLPDSRNFVDLISLHYPVGKVEKVAEILNLKEAAQFTLKRRAITSL